MLQIFLLLSLLFIPALILIVYQGRKSESAAIERSELNRALFAERLNDENIALPEQVKVEAQKALLADNELASENLNEDRVLPVPFRLMIVILLIAIASLIYLTKGNLTKQHQYQEITQLVQNDSDNQQLSTVFAKEGLTTQQAGELYFLGLRIKVYLNPQDAKGWNELGIAWGNVKQFDQAQLAFEKSLAINPKNPDSMVAYAQALMMAGQNTAQANYLLQSALLIEPQHDSALLFLGFHHAKQQQWQNAIDVWTQLLQKPGRDEQSKQRIQQQIDMAKSRLKTNNVAAQRIIKIKLTIDDEVYAELHKEVSIFVVAKAKGGRIPLGVKKLTLANLPELIQITEHDAMMANQSILNTDVFDLSAIISKSGNAIAKTGDYKIVLQNVSLAELENVISLHISKRNLLKQ